MSEDTKFETPYYQVYDFLTELKDKIDDGKKRKLLPESLYTQLSVLIDDELAYVKMGEEKGYELK